MLVFMAKELVQAAALTRKGNVWKVVIAKPGLGARDQKFSREILMKDGPKALPKGTRSWITHKPAQERDPREKFGTFVTDAYYDDTLPKEKYPEGALVSELKISQQYIDLAEELVEDGHADMSVFVDGDLDHEGNVTSILPARDNSVDLVAYAGLEGAQMIEKISESFISGSAKPGNETSVPVMKEGNVEKELTDAIEAAVKAAITALAAQQKTEADAKVQAKVDADAVDAAVETRLDAYDETIALIDAEKDLTPAMVQSLRSAARKGEDVKPLIQSYKDTVADVTKALTQSFESKGVRITEGAPKSADLKIAGWAN